MGAAPDPFCAPCPDCRGRGYHEEVLGGGARVVAPCSSCKGMGSKEGSVHAPARGRA